MQNTINFYFIRIWRNACAGAIAIMIGAIASACTANDSFNEIPVNELGATQESDYQCLDGPNTLKVEKDFPIIFTGVVQEVLPKLPNQSFVSNACWAHFSIVKNIRGEVKASTWVKAIYKVAIPKDFESLEYCPFKLGQAYRVYGEPGQNPHLEVKSFVTVGSCSLSRRID